MSKLVIFDLDDTLLCTDSEFHFTKYIVKKGQNIALIGSTGRSTGPHVHFEVYKNGRVVDPAAYIHRTAR